MAGLGALTNHTPRMPTDAVLMLTDLVDSTRLGERLGDAQAAAWWQAHDRVARDLLHRWHGREIDKSDGFLLLFEHIDDAVGHALAYHRALRQLQPPLQARAGLHVGAVMTRANDAQDIARGAKPLEVEGLAKAIAARIMALALGGQTLLSAAARSALGPASWRLHSHGHWRLKGLAEPLELFEVGDAGVVFAPPPDSPKAYRVLMAQGHWSPVRELAHNLPAERDALIGRADMLAALAEHLDAGCRLVSLLGIGGIGKTRVALRYARSWLGDYPGGAWFCDLSQARSANGIVHAVAHGLDVPLGKADPINQLGAAIAGRGPCLVILDNFEQVARHAESTLGVWLERAPQARFIVTSRELLGIAGEQALVLAPMALDDAVQLFCRRVEAAGLGPAGDALDAAESADIALLVELLDRLPLAIELAAARVRVLPVKALLQRMGERFSLLTSTSGRRDRRATLIATLDWSWDLLTAAEQSALAQLSVFEGGFTLRAAEAVVDLSMAGSAPWVANVVQSLLDKSLIRSLPGHRLGLLRTVQDYVCARSAASASAGTGPHDLAPAERRHWRYFAGLDERQAIAERCVELGNLVVACRRAAAAEPAQAVAALVNVWAALRLTGPFETARELVTHVESFGLCDARSQIDLDWIMASAQQHQGELASARGRIELALTRAGQLADPSARARLLCSMAELSMAAGQNQAAMAQLVEANGLELSASDAPLRCRILNTLGGLDLAESRLTSAATHYQAAMALALHMGDLHWQGGLHGNLGVVRYAEGRLHEAREHYEKALRLTEQVGDRRWEGNTRCNFALLRHDLGDHSGAESELIAVLQLARAMGHRRLECTALCNLGIVTEALGITEAALDHYRHAVTMATELGDQRSQGQFRGYLGLLLARTGSGAEALDCLELAQTLLHDGGDPASLGLLLCQSCMAAGCLGNEALARQQLLRAESLLSSLPVAPESELGRALQAARVSQS